MHTSYVDLCDLDFCCYLEVVSLTAPVVAPPIELKYFGGICSWVRESARQCKADSGTTFHVTNSGLEKARRSRS